MIIARGVGCIGGGGSLMLGTDPFAGSPSEFDIDTLPVGKDEVDGPKLSEIAALGTFPFVLPIEPRKVGCTRFLSFLPLLATRILTCSPVPFAVAPENPLPDDCTLL